MGLLRQVGLCQCFVWEDLRGELWGLQALHSLQKRSGRELEIFWGEQAQKEREDGEEEKTLVSYFSACISKD